MAKLDLAAARDRTIPDVLPEPGAVLRVLFCGINPGLYSAATGWHFARPGNRFWPALARSGFTPRLLAPREQDLLPGYGLGITNLVPRATAQAAELTDAELRSGGERLAALVRSHRPRIVAVAGVTAYRTAFGHPRTAIGPQPEPLAGARAWVLPNPSGLNAHWSLDTIAAQFAALRAAAGEALWGAPGEPAAQASWRAVPGSWQFPGDQIPAPPWVPLAPVAKSAAPRRRQRFSGKISPAMAEAGARSLACPPGDHQHDQEA